MRTTLTIDDDIAAELARLRKERDISLTQMLNEALRRGLEGMGVEPKRPRSLTRSFDTGRLLIDSIDCIGEVLAVLDAEKLRDSG